jgi:UDP-N-acetylglucosamine 2-epimerase (non-hydrolysing)
MTQPNPIKVMVVLGTRPEAIKLAPVIQTLQRRARSGEVAVKVCVTGQHREMLDQVMNLFGIVPDINLDLMQPGQTPSQVAARVLLEIEPVLQRERPDWVLVQGDTTTVMATAIAAHHMRIKVGHVEAGLRTGDRFNPFPEEMNRVIASHIADLHFAPTQQARQNLLREGIAAHIILVTGNTIIDALLEIAERPAPPEVAQFTTDRRRLVLVTAHRRENFGAPLKDICLALKSLAETRPELRIVYPVHLNPNVQVPVRAALGDVPNIFLLPPVDYLLLVHLMKASALILTDSGGIQEEAPSLGKPVLVLRQTTERPEAVEAGAVRLVGTDPAAIIAAATQLLDDEQLYSVMAQAINPYGDGNAAERIVDALVQESQPAVAVA